MKAKQREAAPRRAAGRAPTRIEQPVLAFSSAGRFARWLDRHHAGHPGLWLKIYKKATGHPTVTYAEALDLALCYGWIDGQRRRGDDKTWLLKFTRRRPRSEWSRINVGHVERLTRAGRMQPAGLAAVAAAKADGRWERACTSFGSTELPADFAQALAGFPAAGDFFNTLSRTNRCVMLYRLQTAKRPETRARRLRDFIGLLRRGEKLR